MVLLVLRSQSTSWGVIGLIQTELGGKHNSAIAPNPMFFAVYSILYIRDGREIRAGNPVNFGWLLKKHKKTCERV